MTYPFAVPQRLPQIYGRVLHYWEDLKRGDNEIPFSDDVNLTLLPDLADRLMLAEAFERPQRFRVNSVGQMVAELYGSNVTGKFADEIEPKAPFEFLIAQASAALEMRAPTYFGNEAATSGKKLGYGRLLLPMWGNGRIDTILGLVVAA